MSTASITKPETAATIPPRPKKRFRKRLVLAVLLTAVLVCLLTPSIFQFEVRHAAILIAHLHGIDLGIDKVTGSIFEPVSFYGIRLTALSAAHTASDISIDRADVTLSPANLLFKRGAGFLRAVSIDGANGTFIFQPGGSGAGSLSSQRGEGGNPWVEKLIPSKIDAIHVNLLFQRGKDSVELQNLRGVVSDREPGTIEIGRIIVKQSWLAKTFTSVKGDTAFQNSRISIANLSLEKNLAVTNASSDLMELAAGRLKVDFDLAAFNGSIRGEMLSASASLDSPLEANGEFKRISVAQLAAFFQFDGESNGVVNEGKFTFHGAWRNLQKATLSARFDATDFQLGTRKWNSLVVGATLLENRLDISELNLKQAHNELALKGTMALPQPGTEWWQSEFAFNIAATINNLTELSTLFGPDFVDMSGKVSIDGSINGSNQSYRGELAVSGSNLTYRTAPFDTLRASVKLNGNELDVANLELTNKNDFVRGNGTVNILGAQRRYKAALKASVDDLTRYSAILQKPIVPQPLAGGLVVDWSGDGVGGLHSGAFTAQLKKFRPISLTEPKANPLNADVEATYSPGNIAFTRFWIWDNAVNLSAKVTAAPKSLNLQSIRLAQGQGQNAKVWLEGDALLPFDVWSAWANGSLADLLEFDSPCKLNLTAKNLDLRETGLLSGREQPVKGELDASLTADGTLNDIKTNGRVQLKKWQVALGEAGAEVMGGDADLAFDGQNLRIEKSLSHVYGRDFGAQGTINIKNLRNPGFDVTVSTKKVAFSAGKDIAADTDVDLELHGTCDDVAVGGAVHLQDVKLPVKPDTLALIYPAAGIGLAPALPFDASRAPFNKWRYDVAIDTPQPVKALWLEDNRLTPESAPKYDPSGTLSVTGALRGTGAAARFSGDAVFQNVAVSSPHSQLTISDGTLIFFADNSPAWLSLAVSGSTTGHNLSGWIYGPESDKSSWFFTDPQLPQDEILDLITTGASFRPPPITNLDTKGDVPLELNDFSGTPDSSAGLQGN